MIEEINKFIISEPMRSEIIANGFSDRLIITLDKICQITGLENQSFSNLEVRL